jgi:hypothetical protein
LEEGGGEKITMGAIEGGMEMGERREKKTLSPQ